MSKSYWPGLALVLSGAGPLFAATELEPIVISASRTAQTVDQALASVSVVTRQDIERQQARSMQDVLRGLPGVSISNNGGRGMNTSVFMRGTESDHVLVLVDGVKLGSATVGTTAFHNIPVSQIERVEVVRGPRSSLYGSEAIGGVIHIFTRKGGGDAKPWASLGGGSHGSYEAEAGISGGGERGWYSVNLSGFDTEGFNACTGKPFPDGAGCFTVEPDDDGYQEVSGTLRAGYRFDNGLELDAHALRVEGENEFDGDFVNEADVLQQVLGVSARFAPTDYWQLSLSGGRSWDESDNFKDGVFMSRFDTRRDTLSLQNDLSLDADHLLTLGLDYQDDQVDGSTAYLESSRDNTGVFAQYQGALSDHDLQLSLRRDDNEQFGGHTTGGAAWGYGFAGGLRLTASYGTAFMAPSFNDLYFPEFGNPDLEPEESQSLELGVSGKTAWGAWSLNAYHTRVDELIAFDASRFAPANIDKARILGLEAVVNLRYAGWIINTTLTLLDPENRSSGANHGKRLPRRAESVFRMDADRRFGDFSLGASLFAEGQRYDDLANTRRLGGYATVDLRAEYHFAKAWRLQARIENLLDKDYETAAFYNQPGRSGYLTLRYQP